MGRWRNWQSRKFTSGVVVGPRLCRAPYRAQRGEPCEHLPSGASFHPENARMARASCVGKQGSTESRPTGMPHVHSSALFHEIRGSTILGLFFGDERFPTNGAKVAKKGNNSRKQEVH